jgi:glucokinase
MNLSHNQDNKEKKKCAIGVDLGGSKINVALISYHGKIKKHIKVPTNADQGKDVTISRIKCVIHEIVNQSGLGIESIFGIGIGAPGPLDFQKGVIHFAPNLAGWKEVHLRQIIAKEFNLPVILENDANAAAWGEKYFGAAKGVNDLVCLTLGTGIGGGLIFNGKIYHGKNNVAGEIGHMIVNKNGPRCGCGNFGCLEAYSSATGIKNRIFRRINESNIDDNNFFYQKDLGKISLAKIFELARQGNPMVKDIVEDALEYLGIGITTLVNLLNPEMIVLVGGITNEGDKLLNPLKEIVFHRALKSNLKDLKIVIGQLGEYAGVVGSAALLWKSG